MNAETKADVIYIDLDALLDTRLATLASIKPEYAVNAMKSNYFTRQIDSFPDVDSEEFHKVYSKRNTDILKASVLTNIFALLLSFLKSQIEDILQGGQNNGMEICLNTYPYILTAEETFYLMQIIQEKLSEEVSISNIHFSDKELTPTYCKQNFAAMIRYSFDEWVEIHSTEWLTVKMPTVAFYAPALYAVMPNKEALEEFKQQKLHPFEATQMAAAPLFALRLLDVNMFCIHELVRSKKHINQTNSTTSSNDSIKNSKK